MNKPRLTRAIPLLAISAAAVAVAGGGHASAASHHTTVGTGGTLHFIEGTSVSVPAGTVGSAATKCPSGTYPVGGGPSSPNAQWTMQWSDPDRSTPTAAHPNEWTVGMLNNTSASQALKVYAVCSTAASVTGNY